MAFWGEGPSYFPGAADPAYNAYMDQTYGYRQAPSGARNSYTVTSDGQVNGRKQLAQQPSRRTVIGGQTVPWSVFDFRHNKKIGRVSIAVLGPCMW